APAPVPEAVPEPTVIAPLQVAPSPPSKQFEGTYERLEAIKARIATTRPKLVEAAAAQAKLIEALAQADLANQRRQTEKYLVEARFALAR
ncbi:hypothetical protein ABTN69_19510, partial [Acinetobacter baumannii]